MLPGAMALPAVVIGTAFGGCASPRQSAGSRYLYVWAGDKNEQSSAFLAVVDVRRGNGRPLPGRLVWFDRWITRRKRR